MVSTKTNNSETAQVLILQLQRGQVWLTKQQNQFLVDDESAASCEKFSEILAGFIERETELQGIGFDRCIWGEDYHCPPDAPVRCNKCSVFQPALL